MKTKQISISIFQIIIFILVVVAIIFTIFFLVKNIKKDYNASEDINHQFAGTGTLDDPYKIEKVEDLIKLFINVSNGNSYKDTYFKLMNKIDFLDEDSYSNINDTSYGDINEDGNIAGIKDELTSGNGIYGIINKYVKMDGDNTTICSFDGSFNGDNNQITNLQITIPVVNNQSYVGLFAINKGTISNLKIIGNINSTNEIIENTNMFIGMLTSKNEGTIQSCTVAGTIKISENSENAKILLGGLVGENIGTILDSSSSINIESNCEKAGITAKNSVDSSIANSGTITNCSNNGEIKEVSYSNNYTAGIVAENYGTLTSCTNNGKIIGKIVGGIACYSAGEIIASQNTAKVQNLEQNSNDDEKTGGIVALLEKGIIENCKNTGEVMGTNVIGGIASENKGNILNCSNEASISKFSETLNGSVYIGGIAGVNYTEGKISNSKNLGQIASSSDNIVCLGGICGIMYNNSIIEFCENNGNLLGEGKTITPNEDLTDKCTSCTNTGGGNIAQIQFGELQVGVIYGKLE